MRVTIALVLALLLPARVASASCGVRRIPCVTVDWERAPKCTATGCVGRIKTVSIPACGFSASLVHFDQPKYLPVGKTLIDLAEDCHDFGDRKVTTATGWIRTAAECSEAKVFEDPGQRQPADTNWQCVYVSQASNYVNGGKAPTKFWPEVTMAHAGSALDGAKLAKGDVITQVDGRNLKDYADFLEALRRTSKSKDRYTFTVQRGNGKVVGFTMQGKPGSPYQLILGAN